MKLLCRPIAKMLSFSIKILNIFLSPIYSINLMYMICKPSAAQRNFEVTYHFYYYLAASFDSVPLLTIVTFKLQYGRQIRGILSILVQVSVDRCQM